MTDDEVLTDLESFNNAMVHFKDAVDSRGNESFLRRRHRSMNIAI